VVNYPLSFAAAKSAGFYALTGVQVTDLAAPVKYVLQQNYPNPFNPSTTIEYSISNKGHVMLKIFDILGREVAELVNEVKSPGTYQVSFDGLRLASGVYIYQLSTADFVQARKMVLVK
jgi:hypothetical protein